MTEHKFKRHAVHNSIRRTRQHEHMVRNANKQQDSKKGPYTLTAPHKADDNITAPIRSLPALTAAVTG
jgi:hypothetical protein